MNQQDRIFLAQFFKVLGALVAFAIVLIFIARSMGSIQRDWVADDPLIQARTEERIAPIGEVVTDPQQLPETPSTQPETPTSPVQPQIVGADIFTSGGCVVCHSVGVAGAPRPGNAADWAPRLAQGLDVVYQHALQGIPGTLMMPKGGRSNLSDAEVRAAVDYMLPQTQPETPTTPPETPVQPEVPPTQPETPVQPEHPGESLATEENFANFGCSTCHDSGREGAPVVGELADWAPRLPQGRATLYRHAIEGFGNMPARGGNDELTDVEVRAIVDYMLAQLPVDIDALPQPTGALGEQIYTVNCQVCHAPNSLIGAPRLGNVSDWAPRVAQGIAMLYDHAIGGIRGMPPRGGNMSLTDTEVQAAVDYMVAQVPAAPQPTPSTPSEPEPPVTPPASGDTSPSAFSGVDLYDNYCAGCHATGHIDAPVVGDLDQWQDRIAQGIETLYEHAIEGFGGMPPRGGTDLSDEEIHAIVDYMVGEVQ